MRDKRASVGFHLPEVFCAGRAKEGGDAGVLEVDVTTKHTVGLSLEGVPFYRSCYYRSHLEKTENSPGQISAAELKTISETPQKLLLIREYIIASAPGR